MARVVRFDYRIQDLIGGDIHADDNAVMQFLIDGCYDVIRKIRIQDPASIHRFVKQSGDIVNGAAINVDEIREIISVDRGGYRCELSPWHFKRELEDAESIYYALATEPKYTIHNGNLSIFPSPAASPNHAQYYYIPEYAIYQYASTSSSIEDFPSIYYEHVLLFAAIRVLQAKMYTIEDNLPAIPTVPGHILPTESLPVYNPPSDYVAPPMPNHAKDVNMPLGHIFPHFVSPHLEELNLTIDIDSIGNKPATPALDPWTGADVEVPVIPPLYSQVGIDTSSLVMPTFTPPVLQDLDWGDTNTWISTEEDSDMLGARINEINAKISEYQAMMDEHKQRYEVEKNTYDVNKTNLELELTSKQDIDSKVMTRFNAELTKYKTTVDTKLSEWEKENDRKMKDFQSALTLWQQEVDVKVKAIQLNNDSKMKKYQADLQAEQGRVKTEADEYQAQLAKTLQVFQAETGYDMSVYQAEVQAAIAKYDKDLTQSMKDFELNLAKYQAEIQKISTENQITFNKYQADLSHYNEQFKQDQTQYQWIVGRMQILMKEYADLFTTPSKTEG